MFFNIITNKRDQWLSRPDCTALPLIAYIEQRGKMRDAQVDAIKTYLYLKIECQNQPLAELFKQGKFNTLTLEDIDNMPLSAAARRVFKESPAAVALYEFASVKDITVQQLNRQQAALEAIFKAITYTGAEGVTRFSSHYDIAKVNANIRKAFYEKRVLCIKNICPQATTTSQDTQYLRR